MLPILGINFSRSSWLTQYHQISILNQNMKASTSTFVFGGAAAKRDFILGRPERFLVKKGIRLIPAWIETYHLTLLTFPLSALVLLFSYWAKFSSAGFIGVMVCLILQYLADLFDGAVGRYRKTGLVKWGFVMDHFLDYLFVSALTLGWLFFIPPSQHVYVFLMHIFWSGVMINSFLFFGVTNTFRVSYTQFGPTEYRVMMILLYLLSGIWGVRIFSLFLPILTIGSGIFMFGVLYDSHINMWRIDMAKKHGKQ